MPTPSSLALLSRRRLAALAVLLAAALPAAAAARGATTTVIGTLAARGQIAQHDGLVVVTQLGDDGKATLAIGGKYGAPRAIHTHTLPAWGQPHVGTSEIGTTVIVYPHCWRAAITTCNLFAFDVTTGTDAELTGEASRRGTGEIEGDMDRGALAIVRWAAGAQVPTAAAIGGRPERTTTLVYQPFGKPARVLPEPGGQQIDLDRGRIAQVRDEDSTFGTCGKPAVEVVDTRGGSRSIARRGCGEGGQMYFAPTLTRTNVVWGLRTNAASWLQRASIRGGHVAQAPTVPFALVAPWGDDDAFQLRGDVTPALGNDPARLTSAWTFALSEGLPLR